MNEENQLSSIVDVAKAAKEVLPQTTAETDGALSTLVGWFNNVVLYPVKKANITYRYKLEYFQQELQKKVAQIPAECIHDPNLMIAGPTLESLKYTFDEEAVREMYVNLLSSSMDKRYDNTIHPGFVDIVKQLIPDEAKMLAILPNSDLVYKPLVDLQIDLPNSNGQKTILRNYTNIFDGCCQYPQNVSRYMENLERLKIIKIPDDMHITDDRFYDGLERSPVITGLKNQQLLEGEVYKINRKLFFTTKFGVAFIKCCIR